jgi:hypothetical protein
MSKIVLLDSGPLGMVTNPKALPECEACRSWLESLLIKNVVVKIPEIADYEVRRELLRANKLNGLRRLDELKNKLPYIPLDTQTMLKAAEFWAIARQTGQPTGNTILPEPRLQGRNLPFRLSPSLGRSQRIPIQ